MKITYSKDGCGIDKMEFNNFEKVLGIFFMLIGITVTLDFVLKLLEEISRGR